jgi:hypothetical protein
MSESADSPFAEFAAPKLSAVEAYQARQEQDRRLRREKWQLLATLAGSAATFAAAAASYSAGIMALPAALGLALVGTLLGLLFGWLAGVIGWAIVSLRVRAIGNPMAAELTRGNSWDRMTVWLTIWGILGIGYGAAWGAATGAGAEPEAAVFAWLGALAGITAAFLTWLFLRRTRRPSQEEVRLQQLADSYQLEDRGR